MTAPLFYNNAGTTLAAPVTNVALTATLAAGGGALFNPPPSAGQYFCLTFVDAATGLLNEIVHVTNVTGDVVTIIRAQEGTTAQNWNTGDIAAAYPTAGGLSALPTSDSALQIQAGNYAADTGTANAIAITLAPVPVSLASITGSPIRILKSAAANTGATTVTINAFPPINAKYANGNDPANGELPASVILEGFYNGTNFQITSVSQSVATALALKAPLASPALTGVPTAPTAAPSTNSTQLATTAYADAIGTLKANIASPTFTGTPAAPTAAPGTSTTQLATTAFVNAAVNAANVYEAYVNFTVSGTTVTVQGSTGLVGVTRSATGTYSCTFSLKGFNHYPLMTCNKGTSSLLGSVPAGQFVDVTAQTVYFMTTANTLTDPDNAVIFFP